MLTFAMAPLTNKDNYDIIKPYFVGESYIEKEVSENDGRRQNEVYFFGLQ